MKKKLSKGDRVIDEDGEVGTVNDYIYPHSFHPDGYVRYTLDDGRSVCGNAHGLKKVNKTQ